MIISHKYKFIFIKTSKTAGTSLEVMLSQICGGNDIFTPIYPHVYPHIARNFKGYFNPLIELMNCAPSSYGKLVSDLLKKNKYYNHITSCQVKSRTKKEIWNNYFKFTIERNPWDKTVSFYHMLNKDGLFTGDFDEYLKNEDLLPVNYPKYLSRKGEILVDKILYYERLNDDLKDLFNELGVPFTKLDVRAKGNYRKDKKHYSEYYYQDWQHEIIKKVFRKEIDLHGYKFL